MSRIDASLRLAQLLRSQVSAFRQNEVAQKRSAPKAGLRSSTKSDLAAVVAQRVQAIAAEDPDRKRKAFRIFLESVLLQELGSDLIQDSAFPQMVEDVQRQMESDPELAAAADQVSMVLLTGTPHAP